MKQNNLKRSTKGATIYRVDYLDNAGEKGYSYFVDDNVFGYDLIEVIEFVCKKLGIMSRFITGVVTLSKLSKNIDFFYLD